MRRLTHIVLVAGTALALSGCATDRAPVDTSGDEAALKATTNAWIDAYNAGEAEKIVALYADDGVLMPPHAPAPAAAAK